jgi:hypothetical protein
MPLDAITSRSESDVPARASCGSAGPPRPIDTITGERPRSRSSIAQWPATAVLPVRFPVPITASFGPSKASRS